MLICVSQNIKCFMVDMMRVIQPLISLQRETNNVVPEEPCVFFFLYCTGNCNQYVYEIYIEQLVYTFPSW